LSEESLLDWCKKMLDKIYDDEYYRQKKNNTPYKSTASNQSTQYDRHGKPTSYRSYPV
jgi:hypothetical protein